MKTGIKVYDAMTSKPITAFEKTSIREIANLMRTENVGSVLIRENNQIKGILTDEDLVHRVVAKGLDVDKSTAKDVMTKKLLTISPKDDLFDAIMAMRDSNVRHLPVVEGKKILGMLTMNDILKIEPQLFDLIVEKIEIREEHRKPISERVAEEGICELCNAYSEKLYNVDGARVCYECKQDMSI